MHTINNITTLDEVILNALSNYVSGRAGEIVKKHIEEARLEIEEAVREEVSKTVLSVSNIVSFKSMENEIVIRIEKKP